MPLIWLSLLDEVYGAVYDDLPASFDLKTMATRTKRAERRAEKAVVETRPRRNPRGPTTAQLCVLHDIALDKSWALCALRWTLRKRLHPMSVMEHASAEVHLSLARNAALIAISTTRKSSFTMMSPDQLSSH